MINILTRTSNRPNGFKVCVESVKNQTYKDIRHIVSYDNKKDLNYIKQYEHLDVIFVDKEKLIKADNTPEFEDKVNFWFSPHNLYSNELLKEVKDGWVMFLDDDDRLIDNNAIQNIVDNIVDEDTMLIWQMRYPNGRVLPPSSAFKSKNIFLGGIGSPCFLIHSKWVDVAKWDPYKCADFRFITNLTKHIPNQKWVETPFIQLNNTGGLGKRIDIK